MSPRQTTLLVTLYTVAVIILLRTDNTEGIRLCGRRLADILNFICEKHGGFHVPRIKRDASQKPEHMQATNSVTRSRRSDPNAATEFIGMDFSHQRGGVVDECCKKQCTLSTLVSYCANARDVENINLHDLLPPGYENMPIIPEETLAESPPVSSSSPSSFAPISHSKHLNHFSRPNLGLSNRDRSVFIVLSQLQEDEDKALGEYRF